MIKSTVVPPTIPERLRYVWANINTHTQTIKYQFISLLDVLLYDKYANNLYRFRYTPLMPGGNKKTKKTQKNVDLFVLKQIFSFHPR